MLLFALFPGSFVWRQAGSLDFFFVVFVKLVLSVRSQNKKWQKASTVDNIDK